MCKSCSIPPSIDTVESTAILGKCFSHYILLPLIFDHDDQSEGESIVTVHKFNFYAEN